MTDVKTYLVTGAAGFIGSNFVKYILKKHGDAVNVIILDKLTYAGNLLSISNEIKLPNVTFIKGDIGDSALTTKIFADNDIDYVVNFAAESHVDRSITNPRLFLETNILGTQNLLNSAKGAWFAGKAPNGAFSYKPGKKYLQISTDEVYGSLKKDFEAPQKLTVDDDIKSVVKNRHDLKTFGHTFFTEESMLSPRSPYSASKTSADLLTLAYHHTYNFPVNITRCSNNYGPFHFPEKLIPLAIKNILEGKKVPVYGSGANVRDWLYVEDHCKAIDLVLRNGRIGEIYNIGGFNEESNINIVKQIIRIIAEACQANPSFEALLSRPISELNDNLIEFVGDRPGHDMRYAINPTKIAKELGWYPETPFAEGIRKTVIWNLSNQDWVKSVTSGEYTKYYEQMYGTRN